MKIVCMDCGKSFELSDGETVFYESNGLDLPKRCKSCRDRRSGKNLLKVKRRNPFFTTLSIFSFSAAAADCVIYFYLDAIGSTAFYYSISLLSAAFIVFSRLSVNIKLYDLSFEGYKYHFYDAKSLYNHYVKHSAELGINSVEEYLKRANAVICGKKCLCKKTLNGDTVYYDKQSGDYVVVSEASYIRTYFRTSYEHFLKQ